LAIFIDISNRCLLGPNETFWSCFLLISKGSQGSRTDHSRHFDILPYFERKTVISS
jgi:hypothetical protein